MLIANKIAFQSKANHHERVYMYLVMLIYPVFAPVTLSPWLWPDDLNIHTYVIIWTF